jgi:DNA ligase D-like protein (predicted ligase)/DNA ligase D-like protein (predicted 3'-phosphoesterase)
MNQQYKPMLAKASSTPFSKEEWIYEIKWDGFRALAYVNEKLKLLSRNQKEIEKKFPELQELLNLTQNAVLDGEIVIIKNGKTDFHSLLKRNQTNKTTEIKIQAKKSPASYMIFDILEKNGKNLTDLPLIERKKILKKTVKEGNHVFLSDFIEQKGEEYYKIAIEKGLEGIIAKKKNSTYEPGIRSNNWLKIKKKNTVDCIVFGYTKGSGFRKHTFGSLLLGLYNEKKEPIYIGKVGTGFSQESLSKLTQKLKNLTTKKPPFKIPGAKDVIWLKPKIVCEVFYQTITKEGKLRMPRFQTIKTNITPQECTIQQITQDKLSNYYLKRNFNKTNEPTGNKKKENNPIFVIQEHHSRRLHYDLRLEKDGVLKSWAVPKGIPIEINKKRLAVEVEDHPIEYSKFEGTIPQGQYGAGTVKIWDKGTFKTKSWEKDVIEFFPKGQKITGKYILVRIKKNKGKNWLLFKGRDSTE